MAHDPTTHGISRGTASPARAPSRGRRHRPRVWALALGLLLLPNLFAQESTTEFRVKAAWMLNFAKFTEWPKDTFSTPKAHIVIGIVGRDPFGADIEETIGHKHVKGHPIRIRRLKRHDDVTGCHVLYFGRAEKGFEADVLRRIAGQPILTVGESDVFLERGGAIQFVLTRKKIRFNINLKHPKASGLKIDPKLLHIALKVTRAK